MHIYWPLQIDSICLQKISVTDIFWLNAWVMRWMSLHVQSSFILLSDCLFAYSILWIGVLSYTLRKESEDNSTLWQENVDSEYNSITKSYKCKSSFTHGVNVFWLRNFEWSQTFLIDWVFFFFLLIERAVQPHKRGIHWFIWLFFHQSVGLRNWPGPGKNYDLQPLTTEAQSEQLTLLLCSSSSTFFCLSVFPAIPCFTWERVMIYKN